jgi:Glycine zipper
MYKIAAIIAATTGLAFASATTIAQQPAAAADPAAAPAAKPLSTSLGLVVFPAKGQTVQTQSQDEGECYAWSKGQTGIDPMAPEAAPATTASAAEPEQAKTGGERVRGAARGAAAGAIIGEVANDDASEGAAIGATVGVVKGGAERRRKQQQATDQQAAVQQEAVDEQDAARKEQRDLFNKGFGACLEAKGYTVK